MGFALYLALLADRLIKGSGVYRTLLIWPYAVAPAVAGVLWLFMFNTRVGVVALVRNKRKCQSRMGNQGGGTW